MLEQQHSVCISTVTHYQRTDQIVDLISVWLQVFIFVFCFITYRNLCLHHGLITVSKQNRNWTEKRNSPHSNLILPENSMLQRSIIFLPKGSLHHEICHRVKERNSLRKLKKQGQKLQSRNTQQVLEDFLPMDQ